jgi:hypothetical protein
MIVARVAMIPVVICEDRRRVPSDSLLGHRSDRGAIIRIGIITIGIVVVVVIAVIVAANDSIVRRTDCNSTTIASVVDAMMVIHRRIAAHATSRSNRSMAGGSMLGGAPSRR